MEIKARSRGLVWESVLFRDHENMVTHCPLSKGRQHDYVVRTQDRDSREGCFDKGGFLSYAAYEVRSEILLLPFPSRRPSVDSSFWPVSIDNQNILSDAILIFTHRRICSLLNTVLLVILTPTETEHIILINHTSYIHSCHVEQKK